VKKETTTIFISILLVTTILLQNPLSVRSEPSEKRFTITSEVTYSNNGNESWYLSGEDYAISLFMNNSWQSVSLVEYSLPLKSTGNDTDGNFLGFLNFTQLEPRETVSYRVKYDVISKPRVLPNISEEQSQTLADISETLKNESCKKEGPWLTDNVYLQSLAHNLAGSETRVLSIVKNFVRWITDNIDYNSAEVPRYPNETYAQRKGDCDDQAILLITLCRIIGIPAYLQVGCIFQFLSFQSQKYWKDPFGKYHVTSELRQIAWHGWAIVYIPPWGWLPVDLTYVYGSLSNPLNAIKGAAVTTQDVIQYMNFTHTDYVGASRRLRKLLWDNDFYVYMIDEMKININFGSVWELMNLTFKGALIATAVVAVSLAVVFIYKWKRTTKQVSLYDVA